jgi:hypothetical protein
MPYLNESWPYEEKQKSGLARLPVKNDIRYLFDYNRLNRLNGLNWLT